MKKIFLIFIFFTLFLQGANTPDKAELLKNKIAKLNTLINTSAWNERYDNFLKYQQKNDELSTLNNELKKSKDAHRSDELLRKIELLKAQLSVLSEYKNLNFTHSLTVPESVETLAKITNPFAIVPAFSHIKNLQNELAGYRVKFENFKKISDAIREKNIALRELSFLDKNKKIIEELQASNKKLEEFDQVLQFATVSFSSYEKKVSEEIERVRGDIKAQALRAINIFSTIILSIIIAFLLKLMAKKYIKDSERYYTVGKIINFLNINIIFLILLFSYIENITYLVTILGFASAGLAIAMKDMFMSMLGWCVIVFGGSFRVGDRVKVYQGQSSYIGDIIDISFLRLTLYEDLSLESYTQHRRAGRIIFVPNNYVFTNLISNYTHHGMRTILDGLDINLSFDSNISKAEELVKKIVIAHSKSYTELAKKTMKKLQNEYSIKNPKVEPRFFVFFEHWGMRISAWYMTNSYAALAQRSAISKEIIKEFNKHPDIKIAYPAQNIFMQENGQEKNNFKENFKDED